ncbi:MAG: transglutaminaseTgpA domain-containing protein [Pseudomonas sp.]
MTVQALIPRNSLAWLLTAQIVVLLPQLPRLPLWVAALWLGCAIWRIQIQRMRWRYPGTLFKAASIGLIGFGVFTSQGTLIGLDAAVMLLLLLFMLKLLEMRNPRDATVVIYLGFFIVATAFLFDQSILLTLYQCFSLLVLVAALVGLHQTAGRNDPARAFRTGAVMLMQAVPLMLVLFLLFPRIGPLWAVNAPGQGATTGLAESMAPADIANLAQSDELAFRASFDGEIPEHAELYWRALTLSSFDGRRWSHSSFASAGMPAEWEQIGEPLAYQVMAPATQQAWVFSLRGATSDDERLLLTRDYMLQARRPLARSINYSAVSYRDSRLDPQRLDPLQQRIYTNLPEEVDPRSRAFAQELRGRHAQDEDLVQALLQHFNREPFHYTLRPPTLGQHSNDEFLFDSRRGFCAHFAGAMTFVLRAAGIPARVVAGYQGGELNPRGNFVRVHQFDAHAWVEVWLPGQGWVSVDPTFQVAPERIERGLQEAMQEEGSFLEGSRLSSAHYRNIGWINSLRLGWDDLNYQWQMRVLGYQSESQLAFLQRWLGTTDWQRVGIITLVVVALVMIPLALWTLRPGRRAADSRLRTLQRVDRRLRRLGLESRRGEGPRDWQARLNAALPGQRQALAVFFDEYVHQTYALGATLPDKSSQRQLNEYAGQLLKCLPRKLPPRPSTALDNSGLPEQPTRL